MLHVLACVFKKHYFKSIDVHVYVRKYTLYSAIPVTMEVVEDDIQLFNIGTRFDHELVFNMHVMDRMMD